MLEQVNHALGFGANAAAVKPGWRRRPLAAENASAALRCAARRTEKVPRVRSSLVSSFIIL